MASVNKCILVGGVTKEPTIKYMPNGEAVANFSIATNETWKAKDGTKQSKAEYHNVVAYRKLAEIIGEWITTGSQIYIEGKLQTRSWEKDGIKRYSTEIVADTMQMLGGGKNKPSGGDSMQSGSTLRQHDASDFSDLGEDIPFMNPYKFCWRNV